MSKTVEKIEPMENLQISKELSLSISKHDISDAHFDLLENMTPVNIEPKFFNIANLVKIGEPIDMIVTDYIPNIDVKGKDTDAIEFISKFEGEKKTYLASVSRLVRVVKGTVDKLRNQGVEGQINIPLRVTYLGKKRGNNGHDFDDFDIVGLR